MGRRGTQAQEPMSSQLKTQNSKLKTRPAAGHRVSRVWGLGLALVGGDGPAGGLGLWLPGARAATGERRGRAAPSLTCEKARRLKPRQRRTTPAYAGSTGRAGGVWPAVGRRTAGGVWPAVGRSGLCPAMGRRAPDCRPCLGRPWTPPSHQGVAQPHPGATARDRARSHSPRRCRMETSGQPSAVSRQHLALVAGVVKGSDLLPVEGGGRRRAVLAGWASACGPRRAPGGAARP